MCGFVGVIDPRGVSDSVLRDMTQALSHRGPDDSGLLYLDPDAHAFIEPGPTATHERRYPLAMGFRRLSVLDISNNGHQPMVSPSGRYAIVHNGEIYNYQELRGDLAARGYYFRSQTDTEVLLYLYEEHGSEMLARLNGMFAFAILDRDRRLLFLARDRMGIKPLYYYTHGDCLLYASEVKAFLSHPIFEPQLDRERLSELLLFRYIAGSHSLLKGVRSVEPGTYMKVHDGKFERQVYWSIPQHCPELTTKEANTQLKELMQGSVKYQLISDVKVGCQLSGGIDSSLVSYWAARQHGGLFDSVSIKLQNTALSEEPYIDYVNQSLGLAGHKATLEIGYMVEHLKRATWHHDFPLTLPNCLGIYLLSQLARKHVTVLLSGEGADEVFGGYRRFYDVAWLARLIGIPRALRPSKIERRLIPFGSVEETLVGLSSFCDPAHIMRIYPDFNLQQALAPRLGIWHATQDSSILERQLTYEQRTYLVELLRRQDKMCMAHGVENRVPLLDHRIVELAKRMPTRLKVGAPLVPRRGREAYHTKSILKRMAAEIYGQPFAYRPKSVFALPLHELFSSQAFSAAFPEYRNALRDLGAFDLAEIDALYRASPGSSGGHVALLWNLIALAAWLLVFRKPNRIKRHIQL